jgi:hypothetical protein
MVTSQAGTMLSDIERFPMRLSRTVSEAKASNKSCLHQSTNPQFCCHCSMFLPAGTTRSLWRPRGPQALSASRRQDDAHWVRTALEPNRFQGVPKIDRATRTRDDISNYCQRHPCGKELSPCAATSCSGLRPPFFSSFRLHIFFSLFFLDVHAEKIQRLET